MFTAEEQEEDYETDSIKMYLKRSQEFTVQISKSCVQTSLQVSQKPGNLPAC